MLSFKWKEIAGGDSASDLRAEPWKRTNERALERFNPLVQISVELFKICKRLSGVISRV
jgi:hypothetical protein